MQQTINKLKDIFDHRCFINISDEKTLILKEEVNANNSKKLSKVTLKHIDPNNSLCVKLDQHVPNSLYLNPRNTKGINKGLAVVFGLDKSRMPKGRMRPDQDPINYNNKNYKSKNTEIQVLEVKKRTPSKFEVPITKLINETRSKPFSQWL